MTGQPPRFFFFDLGNVLLHFDHMRACRQIGRLVGREAREVWNAVFGSGLQQRYERGELTSKQFYAALCSAFATRPDYDRLQIASSAMFEINAPAVSIIANLHSAGHRLGILSNTCEAHWRYVTDGRFGVLRDFFQIHVLSFEVGRTKPDAEIYAEAGRRACEAPSAIFFTDDKAENIAGARKLGWDAVQFTSASQLARDLFRRGVPFNY